MSKCSFNDFLFYRFIHRLHNHEDTKCDNHEVQSDGEEIPPCNDGSCFLGIQEGARDTRITERIVHIRKIESTRDLADNWHDDILDE